MQKASDDMFSKLKLASVLTAAVLATGCISAKSPPTEEAAAAAPAAPVEEAAAPAPAPAAGSEDLTSWTVVAGNHLWGISAEEEVYNVPEQWPLIYKANLDQIEDADLIFPGQVLAIPRGSSQGQVDAAVEHAKTRGAWAVGPVEASDQEYLNNAG
jgi:nucleoid-associated protein YgaU